MPFTSDKDPQGFLNKWDEISASIQMDKIEPATLAQMFQKKLLSSTVMKAEVAVWRRLDKDHPDKTYQWLRNCIETHLRLDREDRNQDGIQAAHRQTGRQNRHPAAPGKGDKGANKGGGKGKGQGGGGQGGGKGSGKAKGGKTGNRTSNGSVHPSKILCRYLWAFGSCNKQADGTCPFDHRAPTAQEIVEHGFYAKGESKGGKADAKGKGKTKGVGQCAPFFQNGACRYGDKCFFSHTGPPPKGNGKGTSKGAKGSGKAGKGKGKRARSVPAVADHAEDDWEQDPDAYYPDEDPQCWAPAAAKDDWPVDQ